MMPVVNPDMYKTFSLGREVQSCLNNSGRRKRAPPRLGFCDEQTLGTPWVRAHRLDESCGLRLRRGWKVDFERRAMAQLAVDRNRAAALLDDAKDRRQTQTGALAGLFGREERFEYPPLRLPIHPCARVTHSQRHLASRKHPT